MDGKKKAMEIGKVYDFLLFLIDELVYYFTVTAVN